MSYNIDTTDTRVGEAYILAKDVVQLLNDYEDELPEINFLEDVESLAVVDDPNAKIPITDFQWSGESSGRSFHTVFAKKISKKIHGYLEVICTWEGGDSQSAFIVEDGVFEDCDLEVRVIRRRKKKARRS